MNRPPPSPEKIASWDEQVLALLEARTPTEKVVTHLKRIDCPESLVQEILARNQSIAKRRLLLKRLGTLMYGVILLGFIVWIGMAVVNAYGVWLWIDAKI